MTYQLAIGDRTYSSWSLRGWLLFERFGLTVKTRQARMNTPSFWELLSDFEPSRLVPAMRAGDMVVGDTLAMAETLAETHPDIGFWPEDPVQRGLARSMTAEMHSGFGALRQACPMNLRHAYEGFEPSREVLADLDRIENLWALGSGGPWLFGAYSIADAFFAPVAARIAGYDLPVGEAARRYAEAHLTDMAFRRWRAMGLAENYVQPGYDLDLPRKDWPGPTPIKAKPVMDATPINETCPYSDDPVQRDALAEIDGRVIGFCNRFCRDKSVADAGAWPALEGLLTR